MIIDEDRFRELVGARLRDPRLVQQKAAARRRRPLFPLTERLLIIAVDHPARGALKAGSDAMAMADRRRLLERTALALRRPGVDGLLATPDIVEDLLLLGELDGKVVFGSMNRGGLSGAVWELDDRMTAYDAEWVGRTQLEGGKMLLRIDLEDAGTNNTLVACAQAVKDLAERELVAMVEPLPVVREANGSVVVSHDPRRLAAAVAVASGLGPTSAFTWLKLPPAADPEAMLAATTLPAVFLGGDPGANADEVFASWKRAMQLPQVVGLVAGRSLLYPEDGDVGRQVDRAVEVVKG